mgnify:CR=1 FL=1
MLEFIKKPSSIFLSMSFLLMRKIVVNEFKEFSFSMKESVCMAM